MPHSWDLPPYEGLQDFYVRNLQGSHRLINPVTAFDRCTLSVGMGWDIDVSVTAGAHRGENERSGAQRLFRTVQERYGTIAMSGKFARLPRVIEGDSRQIRIGPAHIWIRGPCQ